MVASRTPRRTPSYRLEVKQGRQQRRRRAQLTHRMAGEKGNHEDRTPQESRQS